jgi:hypothetical protein
MDFLASQGASQNANGGIFVNDATYRMVKKFEVAEAYRHGLDIALLLSAIAKEFKVSRWFVSKVIDELNMNGRVIHQSDEI